MRNPSIYLAGIVVLLVGACGEVTEGDSGGNPADAPEILELSTERVPLAGGAVTVTGLGFLEGTSVILGTTRVADVTITSVEELTFVAPAGDTPDVALPIQIFNESGSSLSDATITYNPLPTAVSSAPAVSRLSGGGTLEIKGSRFAAEDAGEVTVTIGDTPLTNVQVVDDETITATIHQGSLDLVAVAEDIVVTTANGSATLPGHHTFVSGGLFFSTTRALQSLGNVRDDSTIGIYYVDLVSKRVAQVLTLPSSVGKMARTPSGGIAVRFARNGPVRLEPKVFGLLDLGSSAAEPLGTVKLDTDPLQTLRFRALAQSQGTMFGIGERQINSPCCQSFNEVGRIDLDALTFTPFGTATGIDRNTCIAPGPGTDLLAIRSFGDPIRRINTVDGTIVDGDILSGDTGAVDGQFPNCHGADVLDGVLYAIQFVRDLNTPALVSIGPTGIVTKIVDLPQFAGGLVANPLP